MIKESKGANNMNVTDIMAMAKETEGRRRSRKLTEADAAKAVEIMESGLYKAFSLYAGKGDFVSNSYKYRAPMTVINGVLTDKGWSVKVGTTDAKRSNGNGPWASAVSIDHADGAYRGVA